ncbi:oxidoreductase [Skermanella stibiiresistens SB22]|uniref:Oxidoreductase n=1 Tax=Skermanella stibiiresistens SB22 TaxID=1385369 RepID=W9HF27_9PROT|nr:Gfo/Idh/MocA family oxidoreductase [Skermanella stibiiresistens]EWY42508.1 oxidoreductase [Skermanella stibiiresistens SB22]
MRFLIVGLGSMGKRRIRCLKSLGFETIVGYDPRADRRTEAAERYGVEKIADWAAAAALPVDAWIISTPPDTHVDYALRATERGIAFFTEANVTDPRSGELIRRVAEAGTVGAPSCTMRYFKGPLRIKELVAAGVIGRPLIFTYQCGQYLPDWHPWESYKDFYVSKRETGACREIVPFELAWLTDVFGEVETLSCLKDKVGDIDCDIDDVYQMLLRFRTRVVGHLLVDVIARPAVRCFRLNGTEGTIEWDHTLNRLRVFRASENAWTDEALTDATVERGYIHAEEPYVAEMADFVAAVRRERPWPFPLTDDERVLDLLVRAEASSLDGRHV